MRYLKGTIDVKLRLEIDASSVRGAEVRLEGYSDADYAADRVDRKSVSGGVLCIDGMVVGWFCKKQNSVALPTMEAEFVAASQVASELLGLSELLGELGVVVHEPILMHVDNQAAIKQLEGEDSSGKAKHIDVRVKFVKDFVQKGVIVVEYCESRKMRADLMTKSFPAPRLGELRELVSLE
ncbi:hypothetical protein PR001_g8973 [Phytophthora rubi]|nr:hypothetical protein PR001_g8973 [Phytophthora rubi]